MFGLGSALASAMRKVVDALPDTHQATASDAARRFLFEPETDLLSRRLVTEEVSDATMGAVRDAVLAGHKLRIHYASRGQPALWSTVDPIGLVTVRNRRYLLATQSGGERTYRLSRMLAAEDLPEPAQRSDQVDLEQIWRDRCARFLSDGHVTVSVRVNPTRRDDLLKTAVAVRAEEIDTDGWLRLEVTYQDLWHAEWALWQFSTDAEALAPKTLRKALHNRAAATAIRYAEATREQEEAESRRTWRAVRGGPGGGWVGVGSPEAPRSTT